MVALTVRLKLPPEVEARLRAEHPDLEADATQSYAIELFRRGLLTHAELSRALGLPRLETSALLKKHGVFEGTLVSEDVEKDMRTLDDLLGPARGQ